MTWFVSGTLITMALVGSSLIVRHFAPNPVCTAPRLSHLQMNTYSDAQLVGRYHFGQMKRSSHTLELWNGKKFIYTSRGCKGIYAMVTGSWEQQSDALVLTPENVIGIAKPELNLRFIPVSWGKRFYLVDENEMPAFCDAAYQKELSVYKYPHSQLDYVRYEGNELPGVQGKPKVPTRYEDFLGCGKITARVTTVSKHGDVFLMETTTPRMKPGMRLSSNDSGNTPDLIVISTDKGNVQARLLPSLKEKTSWIKPGHIFTTGSYWHRPEGTQGLIH